MPIYYFYSNDKFIGKYSLHDVDSAIDKQIEIEASFALTAKAPKITFEEEKMHETKTKA